MPLPNPSPQEDRKDFVSRCMASPVMNKEYPDNKQRAAVCYAQFKKKSKASDGPPSWDDVESDRFFAL